jgi:hypothetical protein
MRPEGARFGAMLAWPLFSSRWQADGISSTLSRRPAVAAAVFMHAIRRFAALAVDLSLAFFYIARSASSRYGPSFLSPKTNSGNIMTYQPDGRRGSDVLSTAASRLPLLRWFLSSATLSVPQAAGPVAFSLVALSLTGQSSGGAAMVLAMTLAQVIGAVPLTRASRKMAPGTVLKLMVLFRTLALGAIVIAAACAAPFVWLISFAALAGLVNGAAYGYLRSVLNHFLPASQLPRALGIAATLNEVTFVLAPVAASALSTLSPVIAVSALTVVSAVPALLIPYVGSTHVEESRQARQSLLSPAVMLWLLCAAAGAATVASVEIGAVALAINFGGRPALAIMFTVPLCLASVAGGIWVSLRNRMATRKAVLVYLAVMSSGSACVALDFSTTVTVAGAVLIGIVLAPLGTHYSLVLDTLAPANRRPEVFALLRTSNALGIVLASALLTIVPLSTASTIITCLITAMTLLVATSSSQHQVAPRPEQPE